jgi:hypothetical protein
LVLTTHRWIGEDQIALLTFADREAGLVDLDGLAGLGARQDDELAAPLGEAEVERPRARLHLGGGLTGETLRRTRQRHGALL